ncbi:hypothetical protein LINPERPRIM_LOCUS37713 [Linum perenne]
MPPDFIPLDAPASVTSTLSAPATTATALHPFIVALPPNQLEVYMKIKDIPPAKVAILSLDSLRSHNPGWHASVDRALTQTGLRALTTYGSTFPLVSLQEFWSSFEWMNQRPHRLLKCIRFRLGGVQYEKTLDEFALLLDADATTVDASLGFEEMSTVAQAPYPDIWRFISGESEAKPENGTVGNIAHPLLKFFHYVWTHSLCYCSKEGRHHISLEEFILFRAIEEFTRIHPGWWLARFFHKRTTTKKRPSALPGGPFISCLIETLQIGDKWDPNLPRTEIDHVGAELAVARGLNISVSLDVYTPTPAPTRELPPPCAAQVPDPRDEQLTRIDLWQQDYSSGAHQWKRDRVEHEETQNARWAILQQFMTDQDTRYQAELAWRRQIEQQLDISPFPTPPPPPPEG